MTKKEYIIVPAPANSVPSERPPSGVYSRMIARFIESSTVGEQVEVLNPDNSGLTRQEARRAYQGLKQSLRYREGKGTPQPVEVHSSAGRVFMVRKEEEQHV